MLSYYKINCANQTCSVIILISKHILIKSMGALLPSPHSNLCFLRYTLKIEKSRKNINAGERNSFGKQLDFRVNDIKRQNCILLYYVVLNLILLFSLSSYPVVPPHGWLQHYSSPNPVKIIAVTEMKPQI